MESKTVVELKSLAKARGFRNYSRLRKAELINLLRGAQRSLLDDDIPAHINAPVLHPTPAKPEEPRVTTIKNKFNEWADWLVSYIPPKPKVVDTLLEGFKNKIKGLYQKKKDFELKESISALKRFTTQYTIDGKEGYDPQSFIRAVQPGVTNLLKNTRQTKVKLILENYMQKTDLKVGETIVEPATFHSNVEINLDSTDVYELFNTMADKMLESMAEFQRRGSNWTFKNIIRLTFHTVAYEPLRGNSYIPLPKGLMLKKAIINMKNDDDKCFTWSVLRAQYPVEKNAERVDKALKAKEHELNMKGIDYPVSLQAIDKIERQNPNISINVYGYEKHLYPLHTSKNIDEKRTNIDLLLTSNEEKQHYCLIKNFSRLASSQINNHQHEKFFCSWCICPFQSEKVLVKHMLYCKAYDAVKIELPEKGTLLSFNNHNRSMRHPFFVYADFESFIRPIDTCEPNPDNSYTKQYQKHTPSSFCYYIIGPDGEIKLVEYTAKTEDEDVAQLFTEMLEADIKSIHQMFETPKKMVFGEKDKVEFDAATQCWICQEKFNEEDRKVRDHCHFTGKFRGAAHNKCNLQFRKPKFIPIAFHNLSGYDSHLFVKNLGKTEGNIKCIPNNEEKYISFTKEIYVGKTKVELRFIDSCKFMASSLDKLVSYLHRNSFKHTSKFYKGKQLELLLRKRSLSL